MAKCIVWGCKLTLFARGYNTENGGRPYMGMLKMFNNAMHGYSRGEKPGQDETAMPG
jgi:hypothetical protein